METDEKCEGDSDSESSDEDVLMEEAAGTSTKSEAKKVRCGIAIAMVGLSTQTYPHISDAILGKLKDISESWSDPIRYARNNQETFDPTPALKTWYELNDPSLLEN